jgi:hypothetical protein
MSHERPSVLPSEGYDARPAGRNGREGALIGLAIGDAAGWPARQHRSHILPAWTRRLRRELDTFAENENVTSLPVPFALNQEPGPLRLGPSDDAEWAAWTLTWLRAAGPLTRDDVQSAALPAFTSPNVTVRFREAVRDTGLGPRTEIAPLAAYLIGFSLIQLAIASTAFFLHRHLPRQTPVVLGSVVGVIGLVFLLGV